MRHAQAALKVLRVAAFEVSRKVRVKLVAVVLDLGRGCLGTLRKALQSALEPTLAEVTPGAGHIGPDVDLNRRRKGGHQMLLPQSGAM
jgi:hypothetical protein